MKRGSCWIFVLCWFIVGIFVGIWMDWSAHKNAGRNLAFEVQDYQMANLQVFPGDTLSLMVPKGGTNGAAMSWIGNNPCVDGGNGSTCVIAPYAAAPAGPYFFSCDSSQYSCPDPGVQQSPTGPLMPVSYGTSVKKDFAHLFGVGSGHPAPQPAPPPSTTGKPATANSSITLIASCSGGTANLQDSSGGDGTSITAKVGQTVYWVDPFGFSLDLSSAPAGFCHGGNPGSGSATSAKCTIQSGGQDVHYSITPQGSPACSALSAELKTTN